MLLFYFVRMFILWLFTRETGQLHNTSPIEISVKQSYLVERDADAANIHFQVVWLQTILSESSISDMQVHAYILHIASQQTGIHGRDR